MLNKKITWRKQHKWLGIGMSFFILMFCLSGILLNHRSLIKDVDVSRKYLPSRYEFKNWNGGLLRGISIFTLPVGESQNMEKRNSSDRAGREVERHFCSWRYAFGSQPLLCLCFLATLSELPPDRIAYAKGV